MGKIEGKSRNVISYIKSIDAGKVKEFAASASVTGGLLLASEEIFSSSWFDTFDRDRIMGTVYVSGSGGIFQIEQTPDTGSFGFVSGTDYISDQVIVSDAVGEAFSVEIISNYIRTKYINDSGSAQVEFRLFSFFKG